MSLVYSTDPTDNWLQGYPLSITLRWSYTYVCNADVLSVHFHQQADSSYHRILKIRPPSRPSPCLPWLYPRARRRSALSHIQGTIPRRRRYPGFDLPTRDNHLPTRFLFNLLPWLELELWEEILALTTIQAVLSTGQFLSNSTYKCDALSASTKDPVCLCLLTLATVYVRPTSWCISDCLFLESQMRAPQLVG